MITIQKSAGVFGDAYEFPGTLRRYPTSTIYPTQNPTISYSTICPTEIRVTLRSTSWANPKTTSNPIFFLLRSWRIVFPTRNCYATQWRGKKHIGVEYDYTLHATQDDKHHDNARTN